MLRRLAARSLNVFTPSLVTISRSYSQPASTSLSEDEQVLKDAVRKYAETQVIILNFN